MAGRQAPGAGLSCFGTSGIVARLLSPECADGESVLQHSRVGRGEGG